MEWSLWRRSLPAYLGYALFATIVVLVSFPFVWWQLEPRTGVGVSRDEAPVSGLPANARNVTYYIRPPAKYFEFEFD